MRSQVARKELSSQKLRNLRTLLLLDVLEPKAIGARIQSAREHAGLRQEDLADLVSVATRTIQNYEAGATKPYAKLERIAEATRVTVEWLLHGDPEEPPEGAEVDRRLEHLERLQEENSTMLAELLRLARDGPAANQGAGGQE